MTARSKIGLPGCSYERRLLFFRRGWSRVSFCAA